MARVTGFVTGVESGIASVECDATPLGACAACATGRGCQWRRVGSPRHLQLDARDGIGMLRTGDAVAIEVDDGRLLRAVGWLYMPPLAGLLAGPLLLHLVDLEQGVLPLVAALAGLAAGVALARRWTRRGLPVRWEREDPTERDREPGVG